MPNDLRVERDAPKSRRCGRSGTQAIEFAPVSRRPPRTRRGTDAHAPPRVFAPLTSTSSGLPLRGLRIAVQVLLLSGLCLIVIKVSRSWIIPVLLLATMAILVRNDPQALRRAYVETSVPFWLSTALAVSYLLIAVWHGEATGSDLRRFFAPLGVLAFAVIAVALRPEPRWIWLGIAVAGVFVGARALFAVLVLELPRKVLGGTNAVVFGYSSTLILLACVYGWFSLARGGDRRIVAFGAASAAVASLLAQSRGAWLALPLLAGAVLLSTGNGRSGLMMSVRALVLALLLPTAAVVVFGWNRWVEAWQQLSLYVGRTSVDSPIGLRLEFWRIAWEQFVDQPALGVGESGWAAAGAAWIASQPALASLIGYPHAHNDVLDVLAKRGLAGLAAYLGFLLGWFVFFLRRFRNGPAARSGLLIVLAAVVMGLSDALLYSPTTFFVLCWLLCGLALLTVMETQRSVAAVAP